jgi:branched-chain amino acid transport system permease protein
MIWVNAVIQGALLGGFYALLACGLSLMFGVMRIINLAHGDLAVLGAYIVWLLLSGYHVPLPLAVGIALIVMIALGYLLQLVVLDRSLKAGVLTPLLATFGLSVVIQNGLLIAFSPDVRSLGGEAGSLAISSWRLTNEISLPILGLLTLAVAILVIEGVQAFLRRTTLGAKWRAASEDAEAAQLVGIDANRLYAAATALAVGIAALGGIALALRSTFEPSAGPTQLIFAFEAVVIGGLGSLRGTLIGGIALGIAQALGSVVNPQYAVLAGHVVFLAVLLARSSGVLSVASWSALRPRRVVTT